MATYGASGPVEDGGGKCRKAVDDAADAAPCWADGDVPYNDHRVTGEPFALDTKFQHARIKSTRIRIELCIDEDGRVQRVRFLESSGDDKLDEFVCEHFSKWRFRPALRAGQPTVSVARMTIELHI
jgi:TonB family protein